MKRKSADSARVLEPHSKRVLIKSSNPAISNDNCPFPPLVSAELCLTRTTLNKHLEVDVNSNFHPAGGARQLLFSIVCSGIIVEMQKLVFDLDINFLGTVRVNAPS